MTLKAVFFDNDGVLVDTERLYFQANRQILLNYDIDLTPQLFCEHFLMHDNGLAALLNQSAEEVEQVRAERNVIYRSLLQDRTYLIPCAQECVRRVSQRFVLGLVTSSRKDHLHIIHETTELLPYFSFVIAAGDYQRAKPAPDPYLLALALSGVRPDECVVIEDSFRGLKAAVGAGLRCWIVRSELADGCDFSAAERVFDDLEAATSALLEG